MDSGFNNRIHGKTDSLLQEPMEAVNVEGSCAVLVLALEQGVSGLSVLSLDDVPAALQHPPPVRVLCHAWLTPLHVHSRQPGRHCAESKYGRSSYRFASAEKTRCGKITR